MFGDLDKYLAVFLTGLVVTYLLTPVVRAAACRFGVVDLPNERRPHKHPTARGGGLAVIIGVHAACLMALAFPWPKLAGGLDLRWWQHFTLASLVLLVVGLVDDVRGLKPHVKLCGQAVAAGLMCLSGARFGTILGIELPWVLDCAFVIFWLVAVINAFNLIDGLDGLASGLAIISAIGLCGIFLLQNMPANVLVLVGLIGACLGFLRYNFHPATIFLGDTGSMFLGFILGVISLQTFTKNTLFLSLTIPMLVLGVPIYDALLAIWRRSVRLWLSGSQPGTTVKPGGIMQPDLEHLHHRLLKSGLSSRRVATVLCVLNGALVVFGLLITTFESHAAGIFLLALLAGVYVLMRHLAVIELRDTGRALLTGLRRPTHATFKSLTYPVWDMVWMAGSLAVAMWAFEPPRPDFWHSWFLDLPVWVTPTFSILAASRTYLTVWTRARVLDVLMLLSMLLLGLFLSLGIAMLIDPSELSKWLVRTLVMGAISHPAILCMRVFYRAVEEIVIYFKSESDQPAQGERVVLYGAGGRCQLFLTERGFNNSRSYDGRAIVGLLDDESSLHSQWVYGFLVLGGIKELPHLIARHRITGIVITAALSPASRAAVQELALKHGLHLSEWYFGERKPESQVLQGSPAPALEPAVASKPAGAPS
jgi:UDP-N-acetylmuramyl pentapeptide phosphotransferase/UDP-N-acetylglucosamine-1-phosphate transferase